MSGKWAKFGKVTHLRLQPDQLDWLRGRAPGREHLIGGVSAALRRTVEIAKAAEAATGRLAALAETRDR